MVREIGLEDVRPLVRQEDDVIPPRLEVGVEIGSPAPGEEHLPFEHDPVDSAPPVQLMHRVVLFRIRHRAEQDRDPPLARALDGALQVLDDIMHSNRVPRQVPGGSSLGEEVVHRVDHQEGRSVGRKGHFLSSPG